MPRPFRKTRPVTGPGTPDGAGPGTPDGACPGQQACVRVSGSLSSRLDDSQIGGPLREYRGALQELHRGLELGGRAAGGHQGAGC